MFNFLFKNKPKPKWEVVSIHDSFLVKRGKDFASPRGNVWTNTDTDMVVCYCRFFSKEKAEYTADVLNLMEK